MKLIQKLISITFCIVLLAQYNAFALQSNDLTNHMDSSDFIVVPAETENPRPKNLPEQKSTYLSQFKQFIAKPAVKYTAMILTAGLVLYTGAVYADYASSPMALWNPQPAPTPFTPAQLHKSVPPQLKKPTSTTAVPQSTGPNGPSVKQALSLTTDPQLRKQLEQVQQTQQQNILSLQTFISKTKQRLQDLQVEEAKIIQKIKDLKNQKEIDEFLRDNKLNNEKEIGDFFSIELQQIEQNMIQKNALVIGLSNFSEHKSEMTKYKKEIASMHAIINSLKRSSEKLFSQLEQKQKELKKEEEMLAQQKKDEQKQQQLAQQKAKTTLPKTTSSQTENKESPINTVPQLKHEILTVGSGAFAKKGDTVAVRYTGWLDDQGRPGKQFDTNAKVFRPLSFKIGADNVIAGWNEGVLSMQVDEKRRLFIPSSLGYGPEGAGNGIIPPNADLIFDIELLEIR